MSKNYVMNGQNNEFHEATVVKEFREHCCCEQADVLVLTVKKTQYVQHS